MNQYVSRTLQECQTRLPVSDLRFSNDSESQCAMGFALHFPAPEQRPWLQIFPLNVQTESFLHRRRLSP